MEMTQKFNLSDVNFDSLCLKWATNSQMTPIHSPKQPPISMFKEDPLRVLGELSFNPPRQEGEGMVGTPIQEFFRGKTVFITGGSGFFGKILMEKLIRAMPHLDQIYVLVREKRGQACEERFNKLLEDKVFSRMKAEVPYYRKKITVISGDISSPDLGLSAENRQLLIEKVNVVFHCAANVRFLEPLREAIASNFLGSKHVLDLAREITQLESYVHVSTAYSQCINRVVEEAIPELAINYKEVMNFIETHSDSFIEENVERILQGWPNTYTFSKALCEVMIKEEVQDLPICVFRPSIVMSSAMEPVRGWTDNLYGPIAMIWGASLGVLHSVRVDTSNVADVVPVDYVVNCMIAAAWKTGTQRDSGVLPVYNYTSSPQNSFCWKLFDYAHICEDVWPSKYAIWSVSIILTDNFYLAKVIHIFFHRIAGAILDKLAVLSGERPRLVKIYKKMESLEKVTAYFKDRNWEFKNENTFNLWNSLSEEDKKLFNFDIRALSWVEYIRVCILGGRYYYLKDGMESIPKAIKKVQRLRFVHKCLKIAFGFALLKVAVYTAHILPI